MCSKMCRAVAAFIKLFTSLCWFSNFVGQSLRRQTRLRSVGLRVSMILFGRALGTNKKMSRSNQEVEQTLRFLSKQFA